MTEAEFQEMVDRRKLAEQEAMRERIRSGEINCAELDRMYDRLDEWETRHD